MELTEKCKEDFLEFVYYNEDCLSVNETNKKEIQDEASAYLSNLDERFRNTLIIEWLDSVGIYISIEPYKNLFDNGNLYFCFKIIDYPYISKNNVYQSRQEATTEAIIKVNQIYNERNI